MIEVGLTLARASSGIRLPRKVPMMGKYMPTVASKAQNAQKRIDRDTLVALVTSDMAAIRQVTMARLACLRTRLSLPASELKPYISEPKLMQHMKALKMMPKGRLLSLWDTISSAGTHRKTKRYIAVS